MKLLLTLAALLCLTPDAGRCQSLTLQRVTTPAAGGYAAAPSLRLEGTAGQGVAGLAHAAGSLHWIGFWFPATSGPSPEFPDAIALAKLLPDGTRVALSGLVATSGALQPGGFLYASQPDRASGIRLQPLADTSAVSPGARLTVTGTLDTTEAGERQIAGALLAVESTVSPLQALGMANTSLGGSSFGVPDAGQPGATGHAGLNNVGLLVRCWGKMSSYDDGFLLLDDGSGAPVMVMMQNAPANPMPGAAIEVTGLSSLHNLGTAIAPLLIPRSQPDVRLLD